MVAGQVDVNGNLKVNLTTCASGVCNANGAATSTNSAPVVEATDYAGPVNVTPHDCSVTLTAGGTAQNAIAATSTIHGITSANIDTTHSEPVWFSMTGTAVAGAVGSYPLSSPTATTYANTASYTSPPNFGINHAVSVIAATTGHLISCTYW